MLIVLECPGCGKRYEIDAALAGKKSRCKQCGEVFKIPVPTAAPAAPTTSTPRRPTPASAGAGEWQTALVEQQRTPKPGHGSAAAMPGSSTAAAGPITIVLNCPHCQKRYELDEALAGKKSRCKACGEVFAIPVPRRRASESAPTPPISAKAAQPARWESVLEDEPASFKASRGPSPLADHDFNLPPPPQAAYPEPIRTSNSYRHRGSNPDVGFTIAGCYLGLALLVVMGFFVWLGAAQPETGRVGQIFAITALFLHGAALLLSFSGFIWVLVIAFGESLAQGLLCLLVPCYVLFYTFSRWEDTKGAFVLKVLPLANWVVFFIIGFAIGVAGKSDALTNVAGGDAQPEAMPAPAGPQPGLNRQPGFGAPPGFEPQPGFGPQPRFGAQPGGPPPGFGPRQRGGGPLSGNPQFQPPTDRDARRRGRNQQPEFPHDADAVARSLIQLKSDETHTRKDALNRLMRTTPDDRLAQVVQAVLPLLDDDDGWLVGDAIKTLVIWKSPEAVPTLIKLTNDNRFTVRHEAIKALGKIKDPRGVEAVILRIKEDGSQVEDALKEMGPIAEPALIERLTNPDSDIRRRVCAILKVVGGKETLKAMQPLPADPELSVRVAANDAASSIILRVGPLSAAERKNKSSSNASSRRGKSP
jgi:HEAT repeats